MPEYEITVLVTFEETILVDAPNEDVAEGEFASNFVREGAYSVEVVDVYEVSEDA